MSPLFQQLGLDRLSMADRLELLGNLWDSVAAESAAAPLTDAQRTEIDRRLAAHTADPAAAVPWDQVEAEARSRLRR